MVRFDLVLDEKLAIKFRKAAYEKGGHKKGSLSKAFEEAVKDWIKKYSHSHLTKTLKRRARSNL